jgi:hypothetical protein
MALDSRAWIISRGPMADTRGFLRDNAVLVAAFVLPAIVAVLFILATAIPTWTVPLPQHDLLVRAEHYESPPPDLYVEYVVRDGRLEAVVKPVVKPDNPNVGITYPQRWKLLLFDHTTMEVREIPVDLPRDVAAGETRTVPVDALAGRRMLANEVAPDGYRVVSLNTYGSGGGIVNEVFGMNRRYRRGIAIGRDGRTIELQLPTPYRESYGSIVTIGWTVDENR